MKRALIQLDFANINRSANDAGMQLDYTDLREYLAYSYDLKESIAHIGVNPRNPYATDQLIEYMSLSGWLVKTKMGTVAGKGYKANVDSDIVIDAMHYKFVNDIDLLILCSGDGDFAPLVKYLRNYGGVYVAVAAFKNTCSHQLLMEANSFIDLEIYYADYRQRLASENENTEPSEYEQEVEEAKIVIE